MFLQCLCPTRLSLWTPRENPLYPRENPLYPSRLFCIAISTPSKIVVFFFIRKLIKKRSTSSNSKINYLNSMEIFQKVFVIHSLLFLCTLRWTFQVHLDVITNPLNWHRIHCNLHKGKFGKVWRKKERVIKTNCNIVIFEHLNCCYVICLVSGICVINASVYVIIIDEMLIIKIQFLLSNGQTFFWQLMRRFVNLYGYI